MIDQLEPELRARLARSAETIHPATDLLDSAQRQYRHRRHRAGALTAGAAVAAVALAAGVPLTLHDRGTGSSGVRMAESPASVASSTPAAPAAPAAPVTVTLSGLTFTLPPGYQITQPPTRTKLGPHEADVNDLTGTSVVASASETGTSTQQITIASYEGDVGARANTEMSQPHHFGTDPARRITIGGREAWVSTLTTAPASACWPKPGPTQTKTQAVSQAKTQTRTEGCGAPLPHVTIEADLGPDLHLYLSAAGISEPDAIAIVTSGVD